MLSYNYSWGLFRDAVKFLGNGLILSGLAFKIFYTELEKCLVVPTAKGRSFFNDAHKIMRFSSITDGSSILCLV